MNRKCKILKLAINILISITLLVQGTLIGAVTFISSLTDKKAGVMHHVYYKRSQYEKEIYSVTNLNYQFVLFLTIGILFTILFVSSVKINKGRIHSFQLAMTSFLSLATAFVIKSLFFEELLAYLYFVMVFEISVVVQIVSIAMVLLLDNKVRLSCK